VPAILVNHGAAVARRRIEKMLIGFAETEREIFGYLLGIRGQTRPAKKVLTHGLPTAVVDEELLQPREPFAVAHREIAGLELVAQLEDFKLWVPDATIQELYKFWHAHNREVNAWSLAP
jgi:hypothetical protein